MFRLPASARDRRLDTVRERIAEEGVDAGVWFDATSIEYLAGFPHVVTERPVVLVVTAETVALVVPRLEVERARAVDHVDAVHHYFDYPAEPPMGTVRETLDSLGVGSVAADAGSPPSVMGYEGPSLDEFVAVTAQSWVREARREKSAAELELIRESARWADRVHDHLGGLVRPGANPLTVSERAMTAGTESLTAELGDDYDARTRFDGPVIAGIVSGERTGRPHAYTSNDPLEPGDSLITGVVVDIGGYQAELERTMFVGHPDDRAREYFEIMFEAQSMAIDSIEPGVPVATVERTARDYFEERGVLELTRHHSGHALGMELHEPPYLDRGSDATIRAGDVYAVEPALYTDVGGFRHSDTVVVTADGAERITETPRGFEANVLPTDD